MFNRTDIERYIPQREPFMFVDQVVAFTPKQWARSVKTWQGNEAFFVGHFPGQPVLPGVLILEHMAQTANFLVARSLMGEEGQTEGRDAAIGESVRMVFGMVNRARFLKPVIPPAEMVTEVSVIKLFSRMGIVEAVSSVGEHKVATAKFQFGAMA